MFRAGPGVQARCRVASLSGRTDGTTAADTVISETQLSRITAASLKPGAEQNAMLAEVQLSCAIGVAKLPLRRPVCCERGFSRVQRCSSFSAALES